RPQQGLALVPTCSSKIEPSQIRSVVKVMADKHFMDLESRSYLVVYAALEDDPFSEMQLHTIRIATPEGYTSRSFGTGKYAKEQLIFPLVCAAVEHALDDLEKSAFPSSDTRLCPFKPPVKFRR